MTRSLNQFDGKGQQHSQHLFAEALVGGILLALFGELPLGM